MPDGTNMAANTTADLMSAPVPRQAAGQDAPAPDNDNVGPKAMPGSPFTAPTLQLGDIDPCGNTVQYIYATDQDYVVYFSRLERRGSVPNGGTRPGPDAGKPPLAQRLRQPRAPAVRAIPYQREGVQALLSHDPAIQQEQRRKQLVLGTERAKLQALLSGWPRRHSYDSSIATAIQMALDGDGDPAGAVLKDALATLRDARTAIAAERELAGRAQYATCSVAGAVVGFMLLIFAQHNLLHGTGNFWTGAQAGLLGAMLSTAVSIRKRSVTFDSNLRGNLSDSALRLVIGAVSGGTLVLLSATGLIPGLQTHVGGIDGLTSLSFAVLLGIIAGFVEQLVPGILDDEGQTIGKKPAPKQEATVPAAGAAAKAIE